jgi:hypothetical protein
MTVPITYIKMGQPLGSQEVWGDFYFAYSLKKGLSSVGIDARVLFRDDLTMPVEREIVLLGLDMMDYVPHPDSHSIAWLISHPEQNDRSVLSRYRAAFVSSQKLAKDWGFPFLGQAYDRDVHFAAAEPSSPDYDIVFVGNGRTGDREELVRSLAGLEGFHLWGNYHPRLRNNHGPLPWLRTGNVFRNAAIVVGHTTQEARSAGIMNDRLYAALACRAFLLSDDITDVSQSFPELITYRTPAQAVELCRRYLSDATSRERIRSALHARTKNDHWEARAEVLAGVMESPVHRNGKSATPCNARDGRNG